METHYKIIGGDGREYGPVSLEDIKAWIRDGRVSRTTQIWRNDLNSWLPASQYQELSGDLPVGTVGGTDFNTDFEPVGFWPRVGAHILDQIILGVAGYLIFGSPPSGATSMEETMRAMGMHFGYSFLLSGAYHIGMNGSLGATVGKLVIGARIINADGTKLGYLKATARFFAEFVSAFTFGIGYLIVAFRDDKRALHDLIARTRVVYKR